MQAPLNPALSISTKFFIVGGVLCIIFVVIMGIMLEHARRPPKCFSGNDEPDVWFTPHISVQPDQVPPPIVVQTKMVGDEPAVTILNSSPVPVYWLAHQPVHPSVQQLWEEDIGVSLPPDVVLNSQIVSDTVLSPSTYDITQVTWYPNPYARGAQVLFAKDFFQDRNQRANDRPSDVVLPDAQTYDILLLYNSSFFTATATLTYSLNVAYHPKQADPNPEKLPPCRNFPDTEYGRIIFPLLAMWCVGTFVMVLSLFLLGRSLYAVWKRT